MVINGTNKNKGDESSSIRKNKVYLVICGYGCFFVSYYYYYKSKPVNKSNYKNLYAA